MPFDAAFAADAVGQVGGALRRTEPGWLSAGVALHVAGQVCRGVAWHEVLRVAWPAVTRRRVCAWHVCGAGLSGVLSARGGDVVRIALSRREPGRPPCAALAGSLVAEGSLAAIFGLVLTLIAVAVGVGSVWTPSPAQAATAVLAAAGVALLVRRSGWVRRVVGDIGHGAAILRDPRRFVRRVLPWQLANRALRLGSIWCLLTAVGLPTGVAVVLATCAAQGTGNSVPLPGANFATGTAALLLAIPLAAGAPVDTAAVAALAIVTPVALTLVGLSVSLGLASWLLEGGTLRERVRSAWALVAPGSRRSLPRPVA